MNFQNFPNKVVLITGGGTGIGKEAARRFLELGARVVINGRREVVLQETAQELDPTGGKIALVAGDIGQLETSQRLVQTAVERFSGVDILINNAGVFKPTAFLDHSPADLDYYLNIILKGTFFASQVAVPQMQKRGGGVIVNVGSMWATQAIGATPSSAYSAAKAGVHALTRNLAIELAPSQIRVNTVAPAVVETPVYHNFLSDEEVNQVLSSFNTFHPIGRNGKPTDVVEAILYLAGDTASWITGAILPLDGGVTAGRQAVQPHRHPVRQLAQHEFVAGDYSIADMAIYPWVAAYDYLGVSLNEFEHLNRWMNLIEQRPAIQRGMALKSAS